jgi:hypothetical protein
MNKRQYRKWKRQQKRKLRQLLRNDYPWDYQFFVNMIIFKINQMYEYYSEDFAQFAAEEHCEVKKSLFECKKLCDMLSDNLAQNKCIEQEVFKVLFKKISDNIQSWWD